MLRALWGLVLQASLPVHPGHSDKVSSTTHVSSLHAPLLDALLTHTLRIPLWSKDAIWKDKPDISGGDRRGEGAHPSGHGYSAREQRARQYLPEQKRERARNSASYTWLWRWALWLEAGSGGLRT